MKNKNVEAKVFVWDWKAEAPLQEIFKAAQKNPKAKLWKHKSGSDDFWCVVAETKSEAAKAIQEVYGPAHQSLKSHMQDISIWEDQD